MSMQEVITTLHEFLVKWFSDEEFRKEYDGDVIAAMNGQGFEEVDADTLLQCLPLVAEDLSLSYQKSVYEYLSKIDVDNSSDVNSGSGFEVHQGSGAGSSGGWDGSGGEPSGEDAVAKHIYKIQNITENNSYIDDRDVTTSVNALGDVWFDQVVASGDGAVAAGDDIAGVNTGVNNGVVAGDDVNGAKVTNVTGDGNTTVGEASSGAIIASGDHNILAEDSNVLTGKFDGQFIGDDVSNSNVIGEDAGIAAAGAAHVYADDTNVGGTQHNVEAYDSAVNFGDGTTVSDQSTNYDKSFNTDNSAHDSFNTDASTHLDVDVDDSFNTDASTNDSYNSDDDVKIDDSFQADHSVNDSYDTEVTDSFKIKDSFDHEYEVEVDESFNEDNSVDTKVETEIEVEDSFNSDDDFADVDVH